MTANENVVGNIADAITQEPIRFAINVNKLNILHKIGFLPKQKQFNIYPLLPGTAIRISKIANTIDVPAQMDTVPKIVNAAMKDMEKNMPKLIVIVALAISNRKKRPSKALLEFLTWNADRLPDLIGIVVNQINVVPFMASIISVKGMSLIKPEEMIAPDNEAHGQQSEDSSSTSDATLNMPCGE